MVITYLMIGFKVAFEAQACTASKATGRFPSANLMDGSWSNFVWSAVLQTVIDEAVSSARPANGSGCVAGVTAVTSGFGFLGMIYLLHPLLSELPVLLPSTDIV
jgi:hypothetical protein